ncbi:ATP-binding protein [Streptodolium elevatio]
MRDPQWFAEAPEEGWYVQLPGVPESIPVAREFTRSSLKGCPNVDAIALVVTELATNAVLHSRSGQGGSVRVWLFPLGGGIAVFVYDDGPATGTTFDRGDIADYGRGLKIVEHFALRWGSAGDTPGSHLAWADMTWDVRPEVEFP